MPLKDPKTLLRILMEENHTLLRSIAEDVRWMREDISVNGSTGLESVLRDNYVRTSKNAEAIEDLKNVTHNLKVNRQLTDALENFAKAHPSIGWATKTVRRLIIVIVSAVIAGWLGLESNIIQNFLKGI